MASMEIRVIRVKKGNDSGTTFLRMNKLAISFLIIPYYWLTGNEISYLTAMNHHSYHTNHSNENS